MIGNNTTKKRYLSSAKKTLPSPVLNNIKKRDGLTSLAEKKKKVELLPNETNKRELAFERMVKYS